MKTVIVLAVLAIGLASPALAQYGPQYSPSATGGGSSGYNHGLKYYRLKPHHHVKPHAPKENATGKGNG